MDPYRQFMDTGGLAMDTGGLAMGNDNDSLTSMESKNDFRQLMSYKYFQLSIYRTAFQACLCILGIVGNATVLYICVKKKSKNSAIVYIGILATVDLFTCVLIIPFQMHNSWHYYTYESEYACKISEWIKMASLGASSLLLTAIAVDRYQAICKPFLWRNIKARRALVVSAVCIAVGFALMSPELIMIGIQEYSLNETIVKFHFTSEELEGVDFNQSCHVCEHLNIYDWQLSVFAYTVLALFVLLVAVTIICYSFIFMVMKQQRRTFRNMSVMKRERSKLISLKPTNYLAQDEGSPALPRSVDMKIGSEGRDFPDTHSSSSTLDSTINVSISNNIVRNGKSVSWSRTSKLEPEVQVNYRHRLSNDTIRSNSLSASAIRDGQYMVAKTLMIVTILFMVSWLPYWVVGIYGLFKPHYHITSPATLTAILAFLEQLFFINNAINPLVYILYSQDFREQFKEFYRKIFCRS